MLSRDRHVERVVWKFAIVVVFCSGLNPSFLAGLYAQQQYKLSDDDTWKQAQSADAASPEGQLMEARRALAAGEAARAENLASEWIDRNPRHPMLPEAYLTRGDALLAQDEEYDALFDYEFVARTFTGSDVFVTSLERELQIATKYAAGYRRKFFGMRILDAEDEAEELFIRVQERMPGSRLAEEAGMQLADFYFDRQRMSLAGDAYALFIENYPHSDRINKAKRRLIYANLASFKGPDFDAAGLYEARSHLLELAKVSPVEAQRLGADALLTRIDESDADKMLSTARWYLRIHDPIAAELTIRRLLKKYPRSVAVADSLRLIPEILPRLPARVLANAPDYQSLMAAGTKRLPPAPTATEPAK